MYSLLYISVFILGLSVIETSTWGKYLLKLYNFDNSRNHTKFQFAFYFLICGIMMLLNIFD